ncbi:hypothetical protein RDV89_06135 [Nocardioides zeae]|uniref:Uncharacterized protein n=1 Tax=Nocardioides imazamoxiresistens TaxID=3231893 RepID=A0ABU3PV44_9ACTN|nr:hypothetical protein [Nocardioides zeae]MDT9592635.1 hypothetical protein [Nocardioides zeae]
MPTTRRTVPDLARRAEQQLAPVAVAGADPVTNAWLAEHVTAADEKVPTARVMGQVLTHLRDRPGSWSWSPRLTAFVVDAESGEPMIAYAVPGLDDAAAVREQTHRRLATGVYSAGD